MIKFHGGGEVTVTSDTEDSTYPPLRFQVKPWPEGESAMSYMDHIMNIYWKKVGKNGRAYYDEV